MKTISAVQFNSKMLQALPKNNRFKINRSDQLFACYEKVSNFRSTDTNFHLYPIYLESVKYLSLLSCQQMETGHLKQVSSGIV